MVFNFPKEEIYLKKNNAFKKKYYYNLSGLTIKAKGSRLNLFEIMQVRDHSAAAKAGVLPGDIIVTVNGLDGMTLELNMVNGILNAKPGRKITLVIDRKGQRMKKEFRLENQI